MLFLLNDQPWHQPWESIMTHDWLDLIDGLNPILNVDPCHFGDFGKFKLPSGKLT